MKKMAIVFFLLIILIQPVVAEYVDMNLTYPTESIKGEEIRITFEIINNSNDRLWDGKISIDDEFINKYKNYIHSEINYQNNPFQFSIVEPGRSVKDSFILSFDKEIPIDQVSFKIILKCGKGMCRGGCRPFYLEKTVNISLKEKRAEATIELDKNEYNIESGEKLEIPFIVKNIGDIQIRNVTVELKGDIVSDEKINIPYINPGIDSSNVLLVSLDKNFSNINLNPIIVVKFQDINGNEGLIYKNIKINIIEKIVEPESNISNLDTEKNEVEMKNSPPLIFYFLIFISIISIILVFGFVIYLIKG
jgi:hypothetical protein